MVLLIGVIAALAVYAWGTWSDSPSLDEVSAPGYLRAQNRQAQEMMGQFGVTLMSWQRALGRPAVQAVVVLIAAGLIALWVFHAADTDDRPPYVPPGD